jgi:SAM-dependent methyltransferase
LNSPINHPLCDLCGHPDLTPIPPAQNRRLSQCPACRQIVVDPSHWPTLTQEKARYDLHDNRWDNPDYREYLQKIADHFLSFFNRPLRILDFGSGPDGVLARLLQQSGQTVVAYDPLYNLPLPPSAGLFDAIILCEVFEHLRDLDSELALIRQSLAPDGVLYLRTELLNPGQPLDSWWYMNDSTHLRFLCPESLVFLAQRLDLEVRDTDNRKWALLFPQGATP